MSTASKKQHQQARPNDDDEEESSSSSQEKLEQSQEDSSSSSDKPVVVKTKPAPPPSAGKDLVLSVLDSMNLLEPETRIFKEDDISPEISNAEEIVSTTTEPWAKRVAPYIQFDLYSPSKDADEDEKVELTPSTTVLASAHSILRHEHAAIKISHKQTRYGKMNKGDMLFHSNALVAQSKSTVKEDLASNRTFGCAMQRIGHSVLLGNPELIGGLVTMPGWCGDDMQQQLPPLAAGTRVEMTDVTPATDGAARTNFEHASVVYPVWALKTQKRDLPRLAKVELVCIKLAQYISELKSLVKSVENKAGESPITPERRAAILEQINARLTIAESYRGTAHATSYVLPASMVNKAVDVNKLYVTVYVYRSFKTKLLKEFPSVLAILQKEKQAAEAAENTPEEDDDEPAAAGDDAAKPKKKKKVADLMPYLAKTLNKAIIEITFASQTADNADSKTICRFSVQVPIVPHETFLKEVAAADLGDVYDKACGVAAADITEPGAKKTVAKKKEPLSETIAATATEEIVVQKKKKATAAQENGDVDNLSAEILAVAQKKAKIGGAAEKKSSKEEVVAEEEKPKKSSSKKKEPEPTPVDEDEVVEKPKKSSSKKKEEEAPEEEEEEEEVEKPKKSSKKKEPEATPADLPEDDQPVVAKAKKSKKKDAEADAEEEKEKKKEAPVTPKAQTQAVEAPGAPKKNKRSIEDSLPITAGGLFLEGAEAPERTPHQVLMFNRLIKNIDNYNKPELKNKTRYGVFAKIAAGDELTQEQKDTMVSAITLLNYVQVPKLPRQLFDAEEVWRVEQAKKKPKPMQLDEEESVDDTPAFCDE